MTDNQIISNTKLEIIKASDIIISFIPAHLSWNDLEEFVVCRQKRYHRQSLVPQWFCGFAALCAREIPTVKPHPLYDLRAHTFS